MKITIIVIKKVVKFIIKRLSKSVDFIDSRFLHGRIKKFLDRWALKRMSKYPDDEHWYLSKGEPSSIASLDIKYSITNEISIYDLLFIQYATPYIRPDFLRYDIPLAYLQGERDNEENENIVVDQDFQIIHGLQRFIDDLQRDKEFLKVRIDYIDEWDKKKLFDIYNIKYRENVDNLRQVKCDSVLRKLFEKCSYPFVLVMWPSSKNVWGEIEKDLSQMVGNGFKVLESTIKHFSKKELLGFMDACYQYAGISSVILSAKKNIVINGCEKNSYEYPVKLVTFTVDNPYYIVDAQTGQPFSAFQKDLKMNIRSRYWNKVPNYGYDNIIHGTDNYVQSKLLVELSKVDTNISELYKLLNESQCFYSVIKRTKEITPEANDPIVNNRIIFNSDIDILTTNEEIQQVFDLIWKFATHHFTGGWIRIEEEKVYFNHGEKHNRFLWVKLKDFNVVLFHIQSRLYGLTPQFLSECLDNRRKDNLQYVIDIPKYEVYLRLADLLEHPEKKHHLEYVLTYQNLITEEGLCKAFGKTNVKDIQKRLRKKIGMIIC